jgi:hypothetical protein
MKDVKRVAKVGDKIKIVHDGKTNDSGRLVHPKDSIWTVIRVLNTESKSKGLVFLEGSQYACSPDNYVVLE